MSRSRLYATCLLTISLMSTAAEVPMTAVPNRAPLAANAFYPLPLTAVKPRGWLLEQLRLQANGLTGHLDEFWPDVGPDTAWRGSSGEGWERGPYYLDGLLPLAYLLDDARLQAKVRPWIEWAITHQRPDGSIGPEKNKDWWPNMIMLKVLTQYQEATGDPRVIPMLTRYFAHHRQQMDTRPLYEWATYRWQDEVLSVIWLYNRTGDGSLLELARKLHEQGHNWMGQFANFKYTEKVTAKSDLNLATHNVNNAMALKAPAVWSLISGAASDRASAKEMLAKLDRYHGLPNGMFSGTEHYAGSDPSQGIELCGVVEAMFSLELNTAILGDPTMADRLETITFNALPGTMSPDLWTHQYDQQPNQVMCSLSRREWTDNGPESNLFGLEPNFGCCTANLHQGWPKFVSHLWMATPDGGLVAATYAPSAVQTTVKGVAITIDEQTDYPFRDRIQLAVNPARAIQFPLSLRIPAWATEARVLVNGQAVPAVRAGTFARVDRQWQPNDRVELVFPMSIRTTTGYHDAITVQRGPLIYALQVGENWRKLKQTGPVTDWEIFPTTPWNYALNLQASFTVEESAVGKQPFSPEGAPVRIRAKGRRLPEWQLVNDSAGPLPASPVTSKLPEETLTLVPYGSVRLRVTALPVLSPRPE